jgi:hypothetical protein
MDKQYDKRTEKTKPDSKIHRFNLFTDNRADTFGGRGIRGKSDYQ